MKKEIDERVRPLCEILNRFPGVETFASCGGHGFMHEVGQVLLPHFYASFFIDPSPEAGWSLRLISWASYEACGRARVLYGATLIMWAPTPNADEPPRFDLYGKIDIGILIRTLGEALEHVNKGPSSRSDSTG